MNTLKIRTAKMIACCAALALAGTVYADKPKDKGKADKHSAPAVVSEGAYFTDHRIDVIRDYYSHNKSKGCPPGLAKKGNGCQPPGQAKKWHRGDILPADLVYYDIPLELVRELGRVPDGHKVVRVGTDLLLIAVGTRMVIDALDDLNDMF